MNEEFLHKKLSERKEQGTLRALKLSHESIDFCSNDYLGIVKNGLLQNNSPSHINYKTGATGSRLLTGNSELIEEAEKKIAAFHQADAALIFNSGYDANVGLLSAVPQRGDTIFYDQLSHASIRDGIRLSFAKSFSFQHNDMNDLEKKLKEAEGNIFIITESVFSMDGDLAPIPELVNLSGRYKAHLIIDEAHATGVVGTKGEGEAQHLNLQSKCFARIHTFGKALGCYGAVIVGSKTLKDYLINFSRSLVYTTALPDTTIATVLQSYDIFPKMLEERTYIQKLISFFHEVISTISTHEFQVLKSPTPIQGILVPGNKRARELANHLQKNGFDIRSILYPTVPKGGERLRIILHSFNTMSEIEKLAALLL